MNLPVALVMLVMSGNGDYQGISGMIVDTYDVPTKNWEECKAASTALNQEAILKREGNQLVKEKKFYFCVVVNPDTGTDANFFPQYVPEAQ